MTTVYTPTRNEVETYIGNYLDVAKPDPMKIDLEDIAHALGNICRYGGHCDPFYSVAEHAVFVSHRVERQSYNKEVQLAALHHDDAEAYLGDIPRPLKPLLGAAYQKLTARMENAITLALNLPFEPEEFHHEAITNSDDWAVFVEARNLMTSRGFGWTGHPDKDTEIPSKIVIPDYFHGGLSPENAKELFIARHFSLIE